MNKYRNIGKIVSSFGLEGEVILQHHLGKKSSLKGLEVVFIERVKNELLPYFIKSAKIKSDNEVYLKIEGINTKEEARTLLQKQAWLTESDFEKYAGKLAPITLVGFNILHNDQDLGQIEEIIEMSHQVLARITWKGKEAFIPLHEETLLKIDKKNKQVIVDLPEGLLQVFE